MLIFFCALFFASIFAIATFSLFIHRILFIDVWIDSVTTVFDLRYLFMLVISCFETLLSSQTVLTAMSGLSSPSKSILPEPHTCDEEFRWHSTPELQYDEQCKFIMFPATNSPIAQHSSDTSTEPSSHDVRNNSIVFPAKTHIVSQEMVSQRSKDGLHDAQIDSIMFPASSEPHATHAHTEPTPDDAQNNSIVFPAKAHRTSQEMASQHHKDSLHDTPNNSIMFPAPSDPDASHNLNCYWSKLIELIHMDPHEAFHGITGDFIPDDDDEVILQSDPGESYTAYKRVDKKIHPVSTSFPTDFRVIRQIPEDPLLSLPELSKHPPDFIPTAKISQERMNELNVNPTGFLSSEEEKLFKHVLVLNESGIAFVDAERGTLKESYFTPYIIPTIPHIPWEYQNIPIPPGLMPKVLEVLKLKIDAGVYEHSQSSYRSKWFVVLKKNGKLRIVHDLQPLNQVSIRDAGMMPIVDDFVENFAGHQCYTVFDLFWGFDARKIDPRSRDLTAFMTPLGLLQITSLPTGYTNSPAEFQKCMVFILKDEIPHTANIFIDDLPIKGPCTQYLDVNGKPEILSENPGIRQFIWEHAQDVHRIMHKIKTAGATFSANKSQICRPEALIVGQRCNSQGREPDTEKVSKILTWPVLQTPKQVRQFLGLCGTVRIWIPNYSQIVKPLTELYHKDKVFAWNERRQEAFDTIKGLVATSPALHPIDYESDRPVILAVDSSKEAVGMILFQIDENGRKRPARYGSIPMSERESRYSQPKLELFGLYRALRHWRLYIIGVKTLHVEVDAQHIKGMLNEPDLQPNAAINRWIQWILMFDFTLIHVAADKHKGPDALS